MFPNRASEGDRKTLPPISSLSSHPTDYASGEPHTRDAEMVSRLPPRADDPARDRRPSSALDHRQTPPAGLHPRSHPPREMEPLRAGPFSRPGDEAYRGPPVSSKLAHNGPASIVGHRDPERGSPTSDEGAWRSYDRSDPRSGANELYSRNMPPAYQGHMDDARLPPWQRLSEDQHRHRMPAPPAAPRDDGPWRPAGASSRDRPDVHPEAFAHDRARDEERWRDERGARPMYPYGDGAAFAAMPPYPHDARGPVRPFEADAADDGRRIRQRPGSSLVDDAHNVSRYTPPGSRPYGAGTYSPPESRRHGAPANPPPMRAGMMPGMEPPRPNTSLGTVPSASVAPQASASQPPATTNTVNANRRVAHLLSEQKRRESINTGFEDLRQAIPACRDGQDSKATILKRALEYIRELEGVVERQHRLPLEGHTLGGYSNRSPPDDKDGLRRFGRHGGDDDRRGSNSARQMTGGSNSSNSSGDAGSGPRIGGLPSNAYGSGPSVVYASSAPTSHHAGEYRPYGSPRFPSPNTNAAPVEVSRNAVNGSNAATKRWADDSDEDQRSPSRRRVSDGDKNDAQRSPPRSNYTIARPAPHTRSPLLRSPNMWHPRMENKSLVDSAVRV